MANQPGHGNPFNIHLYGIQQENVNCIFQCGSPPIAVTVNGVCDACRNARHDNVLAPGLHCRFSFCDNQQRYVPLCLKLPRLPNNQIRRRCNACRRKPPYLPTSAVIDAEDAGFMAPHNLMRYVPAGRIEMRFLVPLDRLRAVDLADLGFLVPLDRLRAVDLADLGLGPRPRVVQELIWAFVGGLLIGALVAGLCSSKRKQSRE